MIINNLLIQFLFLLNIYVEFLIFNSIFIEKNFKKHYFVFSGNHYLNTFIINNLTFFG